MATGQLNRVLRHLHRVALAADAGVTDGQLLERFLARREEAAFEGLLRRHGPMVLGVCRRVLQNADDAEDAFQATFLVLVRKAASVVPRETVGNWLYGVAYRTALKARELLGRRRAKERNMARREAVVQPPWDEVRALLDQELSRLPDKYRLPVVLCDLEGKKRKDVANQLGWPEGTLSCRLARARSLLAKRLARHGLALSGASLGAALSTSASAGVPETLAAGTIRAAMQTAAGYAAAGGLVSARVAALTEGVLQVMSLSKMKTSFFVVLAAGAMLTAGGALAQLPATGQSSSPANRGSLHDTLLVLDQQFWDAGAKHDTDTLGRLFADDFVGLTPDGIRWTRSALLEQYKQVRTGELQVTKPKEVFRLNPNTAVLTYEAKYKIFNRDGKVRDIAHQRMTSCWVQRDGGWFVKFSQASPVPGPATAAVPFFTTDSDGNLTVPYNMKPSTFYFGDLSTLEYTTPILRDVSPSMLYTPAPARTVKYGRPVVTARQAEKGSAEVRDFSWRESAGAAMPFHIILARPAHVGPSVPGQEESSFPDLKEGIRLSSGTLNRVTELTVDGTLQKAHTEFNRTALEVTVPTTGAKELNVEGFLLAGKIRVLIDGKEGKLADLKKGMQISLRVVKESALAVSAEVRAGKSVDSLQPKEAEAKQSSAAQDMQNIYLLNTVGYYEDLRPWLNKINGPTK